MNIQNIINIFTLGTGMGALLGLISHNIYVLFFCLQVFVFLASRFPKRGSYGEKPRYYPTDDYRIPKFGKILFFYADFNKGVPKEVIWNTWIQILWSVLYIIIVFSYLSIYEIVERNIEFFLLLGIGGCPMIGIFFDAMIRRKCFLNRYKKVTLHNMIYFLELNMLNYPPIVEYGKCIIRNKEKNRKYSYVTIEMIESKDIYNNVIVEAKFLDEKNDIYIMYEICWVKYIVPEQLEKEIKERNDDYIINKSGKQIWP